LVPVGLGVLALVVVVAAAAYVLGHPVIDFGKAQKGTRKVVDDFGSMQVGAPSPAMAPGVLPHQARAITAVRIDGKAHTLYVAPTKKGGFCYQWSHLMGGCRADRHDKFASHVDNRTGRRHLFLDKPGKRLHKRRPPSPRHGSAARDTRLPGRR
jgi:hypothetical protein